MKGRRDTLSLWDTYNDNSMIEEETYLRPGLEELASHYKEILRLLGEDNTREGLLKTPERVAKAMQFLTKGYTQNPREILEQALFHEDYHDTVIVKDICFHSLCEHHILPFYGKVHVAYIPDGTITGLSKIPRVVEVVARRLQEQERMTRQIMECIDETLHPKGVMVVIEAAHMCMQMRGVEKPGATTTTTAYTGVFEDTGKREELIRLLR